MSPEDKKSITTWATIQTDMINLELLARNDDPSRLLSEFCDALSQLAPHVVFHRKRPETDETLPAIRIDDRIRYHGVPSGPELPLFLDALSGKITPGTIAPALQTALAEMTVPARFSIFISPHCPFCPNSVRQLLHLLQLAPAMHLLIIDSALFPDEAEKVDVKSVPTIILDDRFRWSGNPALTELARIMLDRNPAQLSAQSLQGIIEEGKAGWIVNSMAALGTLFPALFELMAEEKWPVRLGAMVTIEGLAEKAPHLAAKAVAQLKKMLPAASPPIQGDLLYLLGEIGEPCLISDLRIYREAPYPEEIREAATEAIESIAARNR